MSRKLVWLLSIVAGVLLFVANLAWWTWGNVLVTDTFVDTTSSALQREDVRAAIAGASVEAALGPENRERPAGVLLTNTLTGVLGNDQFARIFDRLASQLHTVLKSGRIEPISINIEPLHPAMRAYAVLVGDMSTVQALRADLPTEVVIFEGRDVPLLEEITLLTPWIATLTLLVGIVLLALAVLRARARRHALRVAGGTLIVVGVLPLVLVYPLRGVVASVMPSRDAEVFALALLDGFATRLVWQSLAIAAIGVLIYWLPSRRPDTSRAPAPATATPA